MKVTISELYEKPEFYEGKELTLDGWVKTIRHSKNFGFLELNDGSDFSNIQIVYSDELKNFEKIGKINISSTVEVCGELVLTPQAKQQFEIKAKSVDLLFEAEGSYPLQKKRHSFEFMRTIAHLRSRANTYKAVFKVRSVLAYAVHKFFQDRGFVYVHTPIITASDCEGAGELFRISTLDLDEVPRKDDGSVDYSKDFFGRETFLTVSGQLEGETFAHSFRKIYTFGPTFRAENSNTARHAAEFWQIEPEMAFTDLQGNMDIAEEMLKFIIKYTLEKAPKEMEFLNNFVDKGLIERLNGIVSTDFERVTYDEAIELLKSANVDFKYPVEWGMDLQTEHERYICEQVYAKPVFVTNYPIELKSFYMRKNDDNKTVAAMDLLAPGVGEIIGGSQREERLDILVSRMEELNMDLDSYQWYLDLRRYGSTVHSGFGMGFERAVMYITGMSNIRDVAAFPRTGGSTEF